jgi:uncharacterized protein DUF3592
MRAARRIVTIVLLVQVAWALPLGLVLGFVLDWVYALAFCGAALAVLVVLLAFMLVWQRADARRDALLTHGTRVPGLLVDSRPTSTRINNRTLLVHTFEAREAGRVIRAQAKAFTHLPIGAEATIAYDTTDPEQAAVVEDLDGGPTATERWETRKQREMDRRFRNRP